MRQTTSFIPINPPIVPRLEQLDVVVWDEAATTIQLSGPPLPLKNEHALTGKRIMRCRYVLGDDVQDIARLERKFLRSRSIEFIQPSCLNSNSVRRNNKKSLPEGTMRQEEECGRWEEALGWEENPGFGSD